MNSQIYKTSTKGTLLIKHYESLHDGDFTQIGLQPKMCPAGVWTIGWGHAIVYNGHFLKDMKDKALAYSIYPSMTMQQAEQLLSYDLQEVEDALNREKLNLTQNQFDAVISFIFNCGIGNFDDSTLKKRIISKTGSIPEAFTMWNKCNGKILPGLTLRRSDEAKLFMS